MFGYFVLVHVEPTLQPGVGVDDQTRPGGSDFGLARIGQAALASPSNIQAALALRFLRDVRISAIFKSTSALVRFDIPLESIF
jgi:hypothetical protein